MHDDRRSGGGGRARGWTLVGLALVGGCGPSTAKIPGDSDVAVPFSLDACGPTCGDGPFFLMDHFDIPTGIDGGVAGFDLDGVDDDCGVPDNVGVDGEGGIDNRLGVALGSLAIPAIKGLPQILQEQVDNGLFELVLELVGTGGLDVDGEGALVLRRGDGDVLVSAAGTPRSDQTIGLADEAALGAASPVSLHEGVLTTAPFDVTVRFAFIGTPVVVPLTRARLRLKDDGAGGADLALGGLVRLDDAMDIVTLTGAAGYDVEALLEQAVPLLVDARATPDGPCDAISAAFVGHVVPAYVFGPDDTGTAASP